MGFIEGDARTQGTLFSVTLEEMIPEDHFWRVAHPSADEFNLELEVGGGWPVLSADEFNLELEVGAPSLRFLQGRALFAAVSGNSP